MKHITDILERLTLDDVLGALLMLIMGLLTMFGDILQGLI